MASSHPAAAALADDARRIFGTRLQTLAVYGPHARGRATGPLTCLCLVTSLSGEDLDACAREVTRWHGLGIATPLIVPVAEFQRSLDAFPLEYGEIIAHHDVVAGTDLLSGVRVVPADLRRACETQVKSHLLHLREQYLEAHGQPAAVTALLHQAAPAFATLLAHVARLQGATDSDGDDAVLAGARLAGLDESTTSAVLALADSGTAGSALTSPDGARLFRDYLHAVEQLAAVVDGWRH
ncbi:MAG: hypothetical protein AB7I25_02895 [Vicinamibacterales bacterium]